MTESLSPQVARAYLAQLEQALAGVPARTRDDILSGVREDLDGLDAAAAAERIEALGDPDFIAAEARAEAGAAAETAPTTRVAGEARWYPIFVSLLVMLGGFVIPFLGGVAGLVLMARSTSWTRRDKWIAVAIPVVIPAIVAVAMIVIIGMIEWGSTGPGPVSSESVNPLTPAWFDMTFAAISATLPGMFVAGVWLLWRATRAPSRR